MTIDLKSIILGLSLLLNGLLIWYAVQLLKRFLTFQDFLDEFVDKIKEYETHIDAVYNLERFYGDTTLNELLTHSKTITKECENFKIIYLDDEEELAEEELPDEDVEDAS